MCTAFIKKLRDDVICGYNLDIDPAVWNYALYRRKNVFTVGITVGSTLYFTHGVTASGRFSCLPYMNGPVAEGQKRGARIDLLVDRYLRGKYSFADVSEAVGAGRLVNAKGTSMHAVFADGREGVLLAEPGYGYRRIEADLACANFPLIPALEDYSNPFYGKERYDKVTSALACAGESFSAEDGLKLLSTVSQAGQWGTRLSFVCALGKGEVFYCENGDFERINKWRFDL